MSETQPLRIRRLREQASAATQYLSDLEAPIREELRSAPDIVREGLGRTLLALDDLDRALAKLDGTPGAVGGSVLLVEEWQAVTQDDEAAPVADLRKR